LPVKVNGRIDQRLLGEALAVLTKPGEYEGPDKQKAIDKLKALYQREDIPLPTEETMAEAIKFTEDEQFDHAVIIEKDGLGARSRIALWLRDRYPYIDRDRRRSATRASRYDLNRNG